MSELSSWFKNLPIFTRHWFGLTIALSLVGRFAILSPKYLILDYHSIFESFHIWRPASALFYYPITPKTGFHFLINLYFLYNYSLQLETGLFNGRPADYFFMLLFNWICCVIIGLLADFPYLMDPMVLSVLYVWCQLNKDTIVNFWFGTQFKAMYLPWVLLGFNLIIAGGGVMELVGIVVGHLYFFLTMQYPQEFGGPLLLTTPQFLYKYFPNQRSGVQGFGAAPQPRAEFRAAAQDAGPRRYDWGRGNVLGGQN
ncbi:derlin-1-like [Daphnia pulicaria]|uniref:derlin-1-like n=1 Tax=Daphnia pulicaria TaxID=35523 RepID=UPI001EEB7757|nr:derlin-1-like [Daphnia pulicaria]